MVFAGAIGAHQYVTIDHGCGLVTTYSFLGRGTVDRVESPKSTTVLQGDCFNKGLVA